MNVVRKILRFVGAFAIGLVSGLSVVGLIIVLFTDVSLGEFVSNFGRMKLSEGVAAALVACVSIAVSLAILIPVHEAGHLLCGLASGYRFVSFRVFNLTLLRVNGRLRIKRFAVAGTGGQCLLSPPEGIPLRDIPVIWYNLGGVLANLAVLALAVPLFFIDLNPFVAECLWMFALTDVFIIMLNGIPMSAGGVGNDAHNVLLLRRSVEGKRSLMLQLRANALIQEGVRPKDMPAEWFVVPEIIDYSDSLAVAVPLMAASRLIDLKEWEPAYRAFSRMLDHREVIMPVYVREIECEMVFLALMTGRREQAVSLLTDDVRKYIETYRKVMSSKERILCAIALMIENNRQKAEEIYERLYRTQADYLLQGEVRSDLDLMRAVLGVA